MFRAILNSFRTFPPYHEALAALNDINQIEENILQKYEYAFGLDFDHFIANQPEEVRDAFSRIQKNEMECINNVRDSQRETGTIATDFKLFFDYYMQNLNFDRDLADKRRSEDIALNKRNYEYHKYSQEKQKGQTEEAANSEINYDKAEKEYVEAHKDHENMYNQVLDQKFELAAKAGKHYANEMSRLVASRKSLLQKNIQVADEILESVTHFGSFEDELIPKLKERLEYYENQQAQKDEEN